jgi:hypothetical protein
VRLCMSVSRIRADFALLLCGVWAGGLWAVVVACRLLFLEARLIGLVSGLRASLSWLVIANKLKSWLGLAHYPNELS